MPILELPPNPARTSADPPAGNQPQPIKLRTGRYGELEEHEIIHLLDAIDDERTRARFRESVYISTFVCIAIAWFLFYGPRVLFHQPDYKDFITAMKEHDKQITYLETPPIPRVPPHPPSRTLPDRKLLQHLQEQPRTSAPAPTPPAPSQAAPASQPQAAATTPPVAQPLLPLPSAPRPQSTPMIDAPTPRPSVAQNNPSTGNSVPDMIRGTRGQGATGYSPAPRAGRPVQAGGSIISDTQGVDFSAWLRRVISDTQRNWDPLVPEEAKSPLNKRGITGIRFTVFPDGHIGNMILETPAGDRALDEAAWNSIRSEGAYPPLPTEFHGPQIELRFGFYYNIPVPNN